MGLVQDGKVEFDELLEWDNLKVNTIYCHLTKCQARDNSS